MTNTTVLDDVLKSLASKIKKADCLIASTGGVVGIDMRAVEDTRIFLKACIFEMNKTVYLYSPIARRSIRLC